MEYIPCIGNSSYSFWRILLKLYSCFQDGLKICILFSQDPEIFFSHFNLDIFSSLYATDMYREYMPCIGNPAYSFRPILLKLYRYFAAFLWFHMRNLSLAGYNCSGGASCMACSFIITWSFLAKWLLVIVLSLINENIVMLFKGTKTFVVSTLPQIDVSMNHIREIFVLISVLLKHLFLLNIL